MPHLNTRCLNTPLGNNDMTKSSCHTTVKVEYSVDLNHKLYSNTNPALSDGVVEILHYCAVTWLQLTHRDPVGAVAHWWRRLGGDRRVPVLGAFFLCQ